MDDLEALYAIGPLVGPIRFGRIDGRDKRVWYCKEIPGHSLTDFTDSIYQRLDAVRPREYGLARPIRNIHGKFVSLYEGASILLMPFIDHVSAAEHSIPIEILLRDLGHLHDNVRDLDLPLRPHRTYESYLRRGLERLGEAYPEHSFCEQFREFIDVRLPRLSFREGNIHFDLNPHNVWRDSRGHTTFADFDDMQWGPYVKDVFEYGSAGLNLEAPEVDVRIIDAGQALIAGATRKDLTFLYLRPRLPELYGPVPSGRAILDRLGTLL